MTRWMLVTCSLIGCGADSVFGQKPLPKRQQAQLAGIVDAVRNAGPVDVVNAAAPVIGSVSDSLLAAMNEALAGEALPSVGELLVNARMQLDDRKESKSVPKPKFRERLRMLQTIADLGDKSLAPAQTSLAEDVKLSKETMHAYEERLRLIAARHRRLLGAIRQARFGRALVSKISPAARKRLKGDNVAAVDRNGPQHIGKLRKTARGLAELHMALRLKRLDYGIKVLKETKDNLTKERFLAAYSTGLDGRFLLEVLRLAKQPVVAKTTATQPTPPAGAVKPAFARAELNDPNLEVSVAARMKQAEELAGDLSVKTRHFFEGLAWWRRGRFGAGPAVGGFGQKPTANQAAGTDLLCPHANRTADAAGSVQFDPPPPQAHRPPTPLHLELGRSETGQAGVSR